MAVKQVRADCRAAASGAAAASPSSSAASHASAMGRATPEPPPHPPTHQLTNPHPPTPKHTPTVHFCGSRSDWGRQRARRRRRRRRGRWPQQRQQHSAAAAHAHAWRRRRARRRGGHAGAGHRLAAAGGLHHGQPAPPQLLPFPRCVRGTCGLQHVPQHTRYTRSHTSTRSPLRAALPPPSTSLPALPTPQRPAANPVKNKLMPHYHATQSHVCHPPHAGFCEDPPCLVLEYCERGSLYDVLQDDKARGCFIFFLLFLSFFSVRGHCRVAAVAHSNDIGRFECLRQPSHPLITSVHARTHCTPLTHPPTTNQPLLCPPRALQERPGWQRRLAMALDAALGMQYLHSHNPPILHRDLKVCMCGGGLGWVGWVSGSGVGGSTQRPGCEAGNGMPGWAELRGYRAGSRQPLLTAPACPGPPLLCPTQSANLLVDASWTVKVGGTGQDGVCTALIPPHPHPMLGTTMLHLHKTVFPATYSRTATHFCPRSPTLGSAGPLTRLPPWAQLPVPTRAGEGRGWARHQAPQDRRTQT